MRGTLAHELLEDLDLAAAAALPDAEAVRARRRARTTPSSPTPTWPTCRRWSPPSPAARCARAWAPRAPSIASTASRSRWRDGPLLNGFVDVLAFEADGAALVVDYKTDHVGDADPEAARRGRLRRPAAHLRARRAARGRPGVEVAHLFLERPAEPAVARYEPADARALEAELRAAAAPLLAGASRSPPPAPRAVRDLPGPRRAVLLPAELTDRELARKLRRRRRARARR